MKNLDEMIKAGRAVLAHRVSEAAEAEMRRRSKMEAIKEWAGPDVTIQADKYMQTIALIRGANVVVMNLTWDDAENKFAVYRSAAMYKVNFFDSEKPNIKYVGDEPAEVALAWLFEKE